MIQFNNIPTDNRTPGVFTEIDNSRALTGTSPNPHKILILGQKIAAGTVPFDTLVAISRDGLADGFFGPGSIEARMCNIAKAANPNTEMFAMVLGSGIAGNAAEATLDFSAALDGATFSGTETLYQMLNAINLPVTLTSGMSGGAIASIVASTINALSTLPAVCTVSAVAISMGLLTFSAVQSGTLGNYLNYRFNFNVGESTPTGFSTDLSVVTFAGGAIDPDIGDAWAVIDAEKFQHIIQPWIDPTNLTEIEDELDRRFGPMVDQQGHGYTAERGTLASTGTLGNSRNSKHNTIMGAYDSPNAPEEWAAALGAVAGFYLDQDPARPLHTLKLPGIKAPPSVNRFIQSERNTLLFDGIATWIADVSGNVLIERCITNYQTNALGIIDPSYLDIQTLATLGEIRDQYKIRMTNRYIVTRFKLADDGITIQPGSRIATPSSIKQEIIALFHEMGPDGTGLIENLDEFEDNLIVQRNAADRNRVDVLLPPDLINQFRMLAGVIQFIL